jgi:hypothetical protein
MKKQRPKNGCCNCNTDCTTKMCGCFKVNRSCTPLDESDPAKSCGCGDRCANNGHGNFKDEEEHIDEEADSQHEESIDEEEDSQHEEQHEDEDEEE